MKNISALLGLLLGGSLLASGGCAPQSTVTSFYGTSFGLAKESQLLHPEQVVTTEPVTGLDGSAAKNLYTRYQESFKEPKGEEYSFEVGSIETKED